MKIRSAQPPHKEFDAELVPVPTNMPGNLAIKRLDTGELLALRDIMGVPNAPGSTLKYQILQVTPQEKTQLEGEGLVIATSIDDLRDWYNNWTGPKPTKTFPF